MGCRCVQSRGRGILGRLKRFLHLYDSYHYFLVTYADISYSYLLIGFLPLLPWIPFGQVFNVVVISASIELRYQQRMGAGYGYGYGYSYSR